MTQAIQHIQLNKLIPSDANVRHTGRMNGVSELASSIKAHGLLQNLTVRRITKGKNKAVFYEVVAGGRRLAALKSLVKAKHLKKENRIACHVLGSEIAEEISLAENQYEPMHPADQYEAFSLLHREHGLLIEDIAARFGVTATVVRQRLKLGAVSRRLLALYREGEMNLDQLTAFTVTDDHTRQEQVWDDLGEYASRRAIMQELTKGQISISDRRVIFVGLEAYEAAGGTVMRDLFDEDAQRAGFAECIVWRAGKAANSAGERLELDINRLAIWLNYHDGEVSGLVACPKASQERLAPLKTSED
jgi:ParB family transcriptional regulator, chromosome partitioning protein